jgi:hypothetical protein
MAFTTATVARIEQGNKQFQGMFSEMWAATLTVDPASIAAAGEDIATFTVPGVVLGDMVVGYSCGVDQTVNADINVWVSAANVLSIRISNLNASVALDLATSTWKVVIGRPAF